MDNQLTFIYRFGTIHLLLYIPRGAIKYCQLLTQLSNMENNFTQIKFRFQRAAQFYFGHLLSFQQANIPKLMSLTFPFFYDYKVYASIIYIPSLSSISFRCRLLLHRK